MTHKERIKENDKLFKNFADRLHKHKTENKNFKHDKIGSDNNTKDENQRRQFIPKGSPHFFEEFKKRHDEMKNKKGPIVNETKQLKPAKPEWFLRKIEKQKEEKENKDISLENFESEYNTFINSLKNEEK